MDWIPSDLEVSGDSFSRFQHCDISVRERYRIKPSNQMGFKEYPKIIKALILEVHGSQTDVDGILSWVVSLL